MQTVFNAAIDDERIRKNPCNASSVQKPQIPARKVVPWPAERVHAVRKAMNPRYQITIPLGAGVGLRQGEAFGLAVDDVDFDDDTVHVVPTGEDRRWQAVFRASEGWKDSGRAAARVGSGILAAQTSRQRLEIMKMPSRANETEVSRRGERTKT